MLRVSADAGRDVATQDSTGLHVTIGIITHSRPQGLRRLLQSLANLTFSEKVPGAEILVVDNDAGEGGRSVCVELEPALPFPLRYVVENRRGISYARNRVLAEAAPSTDFIAFIDDDEYAEPDWLDQLLTVQERFDADIVAGPVLTVFAQPTAQWKEAAFIRRRFPTGTAINTAGSGNVLIRKSLLDATGVRFREGPAHVGGEDTRLFMRLTARGARMVWADEAIAHEIVPPTRTTLGWILRRAFRGGATWSSCERELNRSTLALANRIARSLFRVTQGALMVVGGAPFGRPFLLSGARHVASGLGNLAGLFGVAPAEYTTIHGN